MTIRDYVHKAAGRGYRAYRCSVKCVITTAVITIIADIQEKLVSIDTSLNVLLPLKRTSCKISLMMPSFSDKLSTFCKSNSGS